MTTTDEITIEIVYNWHDGLEARIEQVRAPVLRRQTRELAASEAAIMAALSMSYEDHHG